MSSRSLFITKLYDEVIDDAELLSSLEKSIRMLAREDKAGQRWCKDNDYHGYTSYASLNDLPERDPAFGDLRHMLDRHARLFANDCHFDLAKRPKLDSLWVNILKPDAVHSGHIHPHSFISGTLYIRVPPAAGQLRLEDPRLPMMMAAPGRTKDAPEDVRPFVYVSPRKGVLLMWESWLRHEVVAGNAKSDRISISFNYR
jgi:uncharacterized protein (TIGR02466 family)